MNAACFKCGTKIRNVHQSVHRKKRILAQNECALYILYDLIARIAWFHLKIAARFNAKLKLFVEGRKETFSKLVQSISENDPVIWMHVASLGEFEQGLPIIERLKKEYPTHKILVTFFSPSGYEVKKNTSAADIVAYLPIDTRANVKRFLALAHPKLALFVKYEIWPNYLKEIHAQHIPTLLISARFSAEQVYFKWYGGFMRKALRSFSYIFLQDEKSRALLASIQIENTRVIGDTRLDRVSEIIERDNTLTFMDAFKKDKLCIVAGSTWAEDEAILLPYINTSKEKLKYVLAPHKIDSGKILGLAGSITKKTVLFSNMDPHSVGDYDVLIIDNIGMLTKVYKYADIAYVGGGFATGLHNTLEPAVFGVPVIIGPNYSGFREAEELVVKKGILPVQDKFSFSELLKKLLDNPELRKRTGEINASYISMNKGASIQILEHIRTLL